MNRFLLSAVPSLAALLACGTEGYEYYQETDSVLTLRDEGRDYTALSTFAMPETVVDLSSLTEDPIAVDHTLDQNVLDRVATELAAYGWQRVAVPADPGAGGADAIVAVGVVASNNWVWYGYYPWYGYGGWWWYYPPTYVPVNYPVGSIIVAMVKPDEVETGPGGEMFAPVIWAAGIAGLLGTTRAETAQRIDATLLQAFDQSAYLEVGPSVPPVLDPPGGP